ncbi:MAG: YHS domain-containing protein [Chitinophaga sp.]|uniref:YHS domain-containing protein n=1 Tax=Chitinophaga sp. TaxID=1869181 RepID=UPI0025C0DA72|nr:YHS domain-containing protein [Chitinophaga sp.]MBV8255218.1 YHS domain-containing protein [Chitinophaga sp.]
MKYVLVAAALFIMSCGQQSKPTETAATAAPAATPATEQMASGKLPDPVCEMPYDTSYHEFTVYKTDTIHFCSTTCKGVFEKNPAKFMAKLGK